MKSIASQEDITKIIHTDHFDPFRVLGAHPTEVKGNKGIAIRAFLPDTIAAEVVEFDGDLELTATKMNKIVEEGFFEAFFPDRTEIFRYKLRRHAKNGEIATFYDSYSFLPTLTEFDLYLFNAGDHHRIYEKLGAHFAEVDGVGGIQFAVWAPAARSVSVIGSFNEWDRRKHPMRDLHPRSAGRRAVQVSNKDQGRHAHRQIRSLWI